MTEKLPESEPPVPLDPGRLREREDVEYAERTVVHGDTDHCGADAAGRAIVGVTDDAGAVLVMVDAAGEYAVLPNETFDGDEDWQTVARGTAERVAGCPVTLGAVRAVRRVEHVAAGDAEPHNTTFQVVVGASADGRTDPSTGGDEGAVDWYDEFPVPLDGEQEHDDTVADVRRFLSDGT